MTEQIQKISTKAIFYQDGKILFVRDYKGKWELPGGRIEFGETPENALKRECEEELGLKDIKIGDIIDAWSFELKSENTEKQFILLTYECFTDNLEIKLNHLNNEQSEYSWFSLDDIQNLEMRDGYKKSIKKYIIKKNL